MKKFTGVLFSILAITTYGQTLDDIELFNIRNIHGTPRFVGMGGAFSALGNDLSAMHLNPAAGAVFRTDQFSLNAGYISQSGEQSQFFGGTNTSSWNTFSFENLGLIKRFEIGGYNSDNHIALGLSYNKLADFDREYTIYGINRQGSQGEATLAQYWLFDQPYQNDLPGALDKHIDEISNEAYAAYQAGILLAQNDIISDFAFGLGGTGNDVSYFRSERGGMEESAISLSSQHKQKVYYGVSFAFPTLRYNSTERIRESGLPVDTFPFDATAYSLWRYNSMQATGFNIKAGVIYRPAQWLRLGASYQSPSWFNVDQLYEFEVTSAFSNGDSESSDLFSTGDYSYRLSTPSIFRLGAAVIFGKQGLLSIDYEFSDATANNVYTGRRSYNISTSFLDESNQSVQQFFSNRSTIRMGAEYRLTPAFAARAGYVFDQSIYNNPTETRSHTNAVSLGLGYNTKSFGIDLAYVTHSFDRQDFVHPFPLEEQNRTVASSTRNHRVVLGFNIKF